MWSTVRKFLVLSTAGDLAAVQFDYTNAFVESVTAFLGIKVKHEKKIHVLSQPSLIKKVIDATGIMYCYLAKSPAATSPVTADLQADPFNKTWEYASIIGMLMFISNNTQPDIAYDTQINVPISHMLPNIHMLWQ
jgi:hypothetical protein